jgi:hypothetical protein
MQFDQINAASSSRYSALQRQRGRSRGRGQQARRIMLVSLNLNQLSALVCLAVVIHVVQ